MAFQNLSVDVLFLIDFQYYTIITKCHFIAIISVHYNLYHNLFITTKIATVYKSTLKNVLLNSINKLDLQMQVKMHQLYLEVKQDVITQPLQLSTNISNYRKV